MVAVASPLLEETVPRSASYGGKLFVLLGFLAGVGLAALLSSGTSAIQEPTIDMAALPSPIMQSATAGPFMHLPRGSALPGMQPRSEAVSTRALPAKMTGGLSSRPLSAIAPYAAYDLRKLARISTPARCVEADKHASVCGRFVVLRAETKGESPSVDADALVKDLTSKLDAIEDKPQAALYAGGAILGITIANSIVSSIEALPLLPKVFELIGTGYSGWFTFRYLLKKESRKELIADIDAVKEKLLG